MFWLFSVLMLLVFGVILLLNACGVMFFHFFFPELVYIGFLEEYQVP